MKSLTLTFSRLTLLYAWRHTDTRKRKMCKVNTHACADARAHISSWFSSSAPVRSCQLTLNYKHIPSLLCHQQNLSASTLTALIGHSSQLHRFLESHMLTRNTHKIKIKVSCTKLHVEQKNTSNGVSCLQMFQFLEEERKDSTKSRKHCNMCEQSSLWFIREWTHPRIDIIILWVLWFCSNF